MRIAGGAALVLLLAGCGGSEPGANEAVANAAAPAEPVPAAGAPTPVTPATTIPAGEGIPGVSAPPPSPAPSPGDATAEPGAEAAAQVLRDYFAAIGDRRFGDAWRLWGGGGQASGMTQAAFAQSFAKYADYRAAIGAPGRIDAGAGQRYIQIPVRVTGKLRDGTPVSLAGPVTLHRTGDIDGATAEQRAWRISDSGLKPRPVSEPIVPQ
ncbi:MULTISPECIES: hypothetical protein [unclassified Sphingomonas]|uniref:hypothetical protein n=1 Tax=unclassified Sphingomonas TaxID=196159 RepID=UPI0006F39CB8|nr:MULTISPECIES: hypothetical protein [unclassified Sphingomonas]KQM62202.1 hypothetical protein ASE65_04100 [Sphingomonas sp. Leaf16]KQN13606.1 hypothetical protein ASE81_04170 [Sphingomonas sp. Leaf29]KQN23162.1 hypothetical protein ASE83_01240 [Sphingomonas sp. Leaf32]